MGKRPTYEELARRVGELEKQLAERSGMKGALFKSRRRLRAVFDFVPYPLAVLNLEGNVRYLNPGFIKLFGWHFKELEGRKIPFVPGELKHEAAQNMDWVIREKSVLRNETRRLASDGRIIDVVTRMAYYAESEYEQAGLLVIFRDITEQKRLARINETLLRITTALPEHPDLEELLDFVDSEVKRNLNTEGSVTILLDEEKQELFVLGAAYDDSATQRRVKEIRFKMDELVASKVIRDGEPIIVGDISQDVALHRERDRKLGYRTRNLALVPLRSGDRIIGVLCALNKKEGAFDQTDIELLNTIAGAVALSVENARVNSELKKAYREVRSLNRAKDRVIHHLSHELKTPVSILGGSLKIMERTLSALPEEAWVQNVQRMQRNLDRVIDIQYQVSDIIQDRHYRAYDVLTLLLAQCKDELAVLVEEESRDLSLAERVGKKVEDLFGVERSEPEELFLHDHVRKRLSALRRFFSHREVTIEERLKDTPAIMIPSETLEKVIDGLLRNAIENTPDEGKIEVTVQKKGKGVGLMVRDYGVGIVEEARRRIFEGFFATQNTLNYRTGMPFDFNAGGKGADLLRMRIFSERFHFKIDMESARCRFIPGEEDVCPGRISRCPSCTEKKDCHESGGTTFSLYFPAARRSA